MVAKIDPPFSDDEIVGKVCQIVTRSIALEGWGDPASVFRQLAGPWRFRRTITPDVTMDGEAIFSASAAGEFSYREHGRLVLGSGQALEAERRYVFRPASGGFSVFFAEPPFALFHEIALVFEGGSIVGRAIHGCDDDVYVSEYRFEAEGGFSLRHGVKGPRKDYISTTDYRRA